jgi:hypothetical protein
MFYIATRLYGVLCKGNGWALSTRDYAMARSLGIGYPTIYNLAFEYL